MPLDPKQQPPYYTPGTNTNLGTQPRKTYRALITQTTTDAPEVSRTLNNTLGTIVWTRLNAGQYEGTLTAAFPDTTAFLTQQRDNGGNTLLFRTGNNTIALQTSVGGAYLDNLLLYTYIQIDIY